MGNESCRGQRQDSANLGCVDRRANRITSRRSYTFRDVGWVLSRWETNRVVLRRQDVRIWDGATSQSHIVVFVNPSCPYRLNVDCSNCVHKGTQDTRPGPPYSYQLMAGFSRCVGYHLTSGHRIIVLTGLPILLRCLMINMHLSCCRLPSSYLCQVTASATTST